MKLIKILNSRSVITLPTDLNINTVETASDLFIQIKNELLNLSPLKVYNNKYIAVLNFQEVSFIIQGIYFQYRFSVGILGTKFVSSFWFPKQSYTDKSWKNFIERFERLCDQMIIFQIHNS